MTYRIKMIVRNHPAAQLWPSDKPTREVTTQFAGCKDEEDAKAKAEAIYSVAKFKLIELVTSKEK